MSWKKFGGIKQSDNTKNLNINSISTDDFTMREAYKGTFKILGEFFVSKDCSLNANVIIGKSATIENDIFVKNAIIIGDLVQNTNSITSSGFGIGINVVDPIALIDISGGASKIMNVYSSSQTVNSTLLKNKSNNQTNIALDNRTASLSFVMGGNTISIEYDLSKNIISLNRDVSFTGNICVGETATILGNISIGRNATVDGNLKVLKNISIIGGNLSLNGGSLSVCGNVSITGDMSMNGNANMGSLTVRNGLSITNDTRINGNLHIIGSNYGLLLDDYATIRRYNRITDNVEGMTASTGKELYIKSDVVISGNLFIDGSTNIVGIGGNGSGGSAVDVSGLLNDLRGTDQTRFYVNYNNNELSDNDLKGAGLYIYNNYKFPINNVANYDSINHGFVKISDVCCNKLSIRTVGDPNVVSLDLSKMKNKNKNGLLVLKYATDVETDMNDNYDIISSHTDNVEIDVSNSLTGVKDIYVGNLISCERDVFVGNTIYIHGNLVAPNGSIENVWIGNLYLKNNLNVSDGLSFKGNLVLEKTFIDDLFLKKYVHLSDGSVIRGNLLSCEKNVYIGNDLSINGNLYINPATIATVGNINVGNLLLENNIYLSDNSVIHGNLAGTFTLGNLVADNISILGNLTVSQNVTISGSLEGTTFRGNSMFLNFGLQGTNDKYYGDRNVADTILAMQTTVFTGSVAKASSNTFEQVNTFNIETIFLTDISVNGVVRAKSAFIENLTILGDISLSNTNISGTIDLSGTTTVKGSFTCNDSFDVSKNLTVTGGNFIAKNYSILTDVSVNNNIVIGNSLTLYGDFKTAGGGSVYVNNNGFIRGNLDISQSTFMNHTYIQGNLNSTGNTFLNQTFVSGNVILYGNLLSNGIAEFKNNVIMANVYVTNTANVYDISASNNMYIGNSLTVYGNIAMNGYNARISNNCFFHGNVTLNNDLYIIDKNIYFAGGNIDLSNGNLLFICDGSRGEITPKILNYIQNISGDIQDQISKIKSGNNVNLNYPNTFTMRNIFTDLEATTIVVDTINAQEFNVTNKLIVTGSEVNETYDIPDDGTENYINRTVYVQRNKGGHIKTNDNIYCIGELVDRFIFFNQNGEDPIIDPTVTADQFFIDISYVSNQLYYKTQLVDTNKYKVESYYEGGLVSCLDITLSRYFRMKGDMFMTGNLHVNGSTYSAAALQSALSNGGSSSSGSINDTVENPVTFGNTVTFTKSITLNGNIVLTDSIYTLTQQKLQYLTNINADVQTQFNSLSSTISGGNFNSVNTSGNINLNSGGHLNITSGNINQTSGSINLTSGNIFMTSGSLKLTSGSVTAASFNASSDYRLKYDIQTISGNYYTVDNLRPVSYSFKQSNDAHIGFIAHELQEQFPFAVTGEKDGIDMQSINYLEIIPILVKEIQELKKEVQLLKGGLRPP